MRRVRKHRVNLVERDAHGRGRGERRGDGRDQQSCAKQRQVRPRRNPRAHRIDGARTEDQHRHVQRQHQQCEQAAAAGAVNPASIRSSVVLPLPLRPVTTSADPSRTANETSANSVA